MEFRKYHCPNCGSDNLQTVVKTNVETHGKNYSASKGCCGALMLGPFGLLCGSCGQGQYTTTTNTTVLACNNCGHEFKRREDLVKAVETTEKFKKLSIPVFGAFFLITSIMVIPIIQESSEVGWLLVLMFLIISIVAGSISYCINKNACEKAKFKLKEYDDLQEKFYNEKFF